MGELRVIDFGVRSPLHSQTLWHAIAAGVSGGSPPTLSFVRSAGAYVSIGYHRRLDEVDRAYCQSQGFPVYRRMVGGGPVYVDADQFLFQISLPVSAVSPVRATALRTLLEPAAAAFRAVGVSASLDADLEICVDGHKVCGHGAGQIEDAVVVCGNLIERFDHARATRILSLSELAQRDMTFDLMRRYVEATPLDAGEFREAMVASYAQVLELSAQRGELSQAELAALDEFDERFVSDEWLEGPYRPAGWSDAGRARQVKVRAGVWTLAAEHDGARVVAAVVDGTLDSVRVFDYEFEGSMSELESALVGTSIDGVEMVLSEFGSFGCRLSEAFATVDRRRL